MSVESKRTRPKLHLISLGCTKNLVDSEVMLGRLSLCELTDEIEQADIIIINTCGFIHAAKQESIQTILEAANARKSGALLVVSGCLSERYAGELECEIPEIDMIIGVRDYGRIDTLLEQKGFSLPKFSAGFSNGLARQNPLQNLAQNAMPKAPKATLSAKTPANTLSNTSAKIVASSERVFLASERDWRVISGSRLHAYIKLSEGCNQRCSFCAIPSFKGKLQSRSIDSILKEIENLAARGFVDFSFIAQDSSSYLLDSGRSDGLVELIAAIDRQNIAQNARIHYLYPTSTSPALIEAIVNSPIVQNYFDMPIQHIADPMLKRMRRNHTGAQVREQLSLMRQAPNAFIRSTFIVGHPGESEAEFAELEAFLGEGIFDRVNLFAFSSEEGTLAHTMSEKIPAKITNKRLNSLRALLDSQGIFTRLKDSVLEAFIESTSAVSEHLYSARDRRWGLEIDGEILINDSELDRAIEPGLYQVQITQVKDSMLIGKVLKSLQSFAR